MFLVATMAICGRWQPLESKRHITEIDVSLLIEQQLPTLCNEWKEHHDSKCYKLHEFLLYYSNQLSEQHVNTLLLNSKDCLNSDCNLDISTLLLPKKDNTHFNAGELFTLLVQYRLPIKTEFPLKYVDWEDLKSSCYPI